MNIDRGLLACWLRCLLWPLPHPSSQRDSFTDEEISVFDSSSIERNSVNLFQVVVPELINLLEDFLHLFIHYTLICGTVGETFFTADFVGKQWLKSTFQ